MTKTDIFISKAVKIHNNTYDYSMSNYTNTETKIKIICNKHGLFEQTPHLHLNHGCIKCSYEKKQIHNQDSFIGQCKRIHNNMYDYSLTKYISQKKKIDIICNKHGIFSQLASNHVKGSGCPVCRKSKGELIISSFLSERKIEYIQQKKFNDCKNKYSLPFDFYIPNKNICIEFDGRQHFYPVYGELNLTMTKENDKIKDEYCRVNNIKLIRISYLEIKKFKEKIEQYV